mmetsp:Transcript_10676/g.34997  ORF Transcript_10676/g.34997 Transcript_10676/m.34997 type:complete len:369 (-) Transcript_10676:712-1818(-)
MSGSRCARHLLQQLLAHLVAYQPVGHRPLDGARPGLAVRGVDAAGGGAQHEGGAEAAQREAEGAEAAHPAAGDAERLAVHLQRHAAPLHLDRHLAPLRQPHRIREAGEGLREVEDAGHADDLEDAVVRRRRHRLRLHPIPRRQRRALRRVPQVGAASVRGRVANHEALAAARERDALPVAGECEPAGQVAVRAQQQLGRAEHDVPQLGQQPQREEGRRSSLEPRPVEAGARVHPDGEVVAHHELLPPVGQRAGQAPPVEQGHAREGERREPRAERLRPKVLSPAEDARHVVPGAERQDGHRGAVGRVELLHLAEHPRHGAVSAADQDAVLRVALAKRAQRLARRHVLQVDHLERGLAAVGPPRRLLAQ